MPERGWVTLTVREEYYETLALAYQSKKKDLVDQDIMSMNAYVNEAVLKKCALQEITGRFTISSYGNDEVVVRDRFLNADFSVKLIGGRVVCTSDESAHCAHAFFVREDPRVKKLLEARGVVER